MALLAWNKKVILLVLDPVKDLIHSETIWVKLVKTGDWPCDQLKINCLKKNYNLNMPWFFQH